MLPEKSTGKSEKPLRQQLFTSPLIPLIYERLLPPLWAAGLRLGGMDEEYAAAARFLEGDGTGVVADVSCGTGFVARRLAAAGSFRHVVALDYSPEMLGELCATLRREQPERAVGDGGPRLSVVRGDAGALPFRDGALDAVHWGAAMHCVPDAGLALREIHRVLRPGGRLYATTFLRPLPDLVFRFFEVDEIAALARGSGFDGTSGSPKPRVERRGVYGVLRATK